MAEIVWVRLMGWARENEHHKGTDWAGNWDSGLLMTCSRIPWIPRPGFRSTTSSETLLINLHWKLAQIAQFQLGIEILIARASGNMLQKPWIPRPRFRSVTSSETTRTSGIEDLVKFGVYWLKMLNLSSNWKFRKSRLQELCSRILWLQFQKRHVIWNITHQLALEVGSECSFLVQTWTASRILLQNPYPKIQKCHVIWHNYRNLSRRRRQVQESRMVRIKMLNDTWPDVSSLFSLFAGPFLRTDNYRNRKIAS